MHIYDCFTFYNEIELLKIRLNLLYTVVDKFVIVECCKNHRGENRSFIFDVNCEEFRIYKDKIIYIQVNDPPKSIGNGDWSIENFQRNCIMRGLIHCQDDDVIMVSDLDEIPNPKIVKNLLSINIDSLISTDVDWRFKILQISRLLSIAPKRIFQLKKVNDLLKKTPVSLKMPIYYYYLNCRSRGYCHGTVVARYGNMYMPQLMRSMRDKLPEIVDGGWHFSYLGGIESVKNKLMSIIDNNPVIIEKMAVFSSQDKYLTHCIKNGIDIYGRKGKNYTYDFININDIGLPDVQEILMKYPHLFTR